MERLTYLFSPWSRVLLEKVTGLHLVKSFPAFYGNRRFITAFTSAWHLSLSWASSTQSIHLLPTTTKIHFITNHTTLPSTPGSPTWSLSLRFPHQNPVYASPFPHTCYMPRPSHSSQLYYTHNIGWAVQIIKLLTFLHSPATSSLLGPNILLNTLFSHILSLRSSLKVSNQVSHPYKTTGKFIVLYTLTFKFLDIKLEEKRFCTEW